MNEDNVNQIIQEATDTLSKVDVHVLDVSAYAYNMTGKVYTDFKTLSQDIGNKNMVVFLELDGILGEDIWEILEKQ